MLQLAAIGKARAGVAGFPVYIARQTNIVSKSRFDLG
jgi:hypothetical protein